MRRALVLLGAVVAMVVAQPASPPPAVGAAQQDNRAVVVVDTGEGEPRRACVVFSEPSITGLDALRAAQMDPVVQTYSGKGGAVCKLCGVGCSAGSSCLTCQSPKYWQYWRSVGGTGSYSYWRAGAGSTEVRDGDVEGWVWGEGNAAPPYYSVETVCSDPARTYRFEPAAASEPATTTTSRPAPTTTALSPPPPSGDPPPATTAPPARGAAPVPTTTTVTVAPGDPGTPEPTIAATDVADPVTTSTTEAGTHSDERELATAARPGGEASGSTAGYVAFVALLGGLGGASILARRRRLRG